MKHSAGANNQAITLSTKLSSTFSEGFTNQYNSPKTITAKGFIMSRTPYEDITLVPRPQKRDNSFGQIKSKATKVANSSALESSTPSQKMLGSSAIGSQVSDPRTEKRSSSKQKCETLRTVSSSPKNALLYKAAESVRREDTTYNANQYKWKKLEINTDFNNTKSAMINKAQTTKYANTDENSATKVSNKQQPPQSASKIAQDKNSSYNFFTEQNDENSTKERVEGHSRNPRPLSSYENNPRAAPASLPQGPVKPQRDSSASKAANRKEKGVNATPKAGQIVTTAYGDLRASTQGYSIEAGKRKERPLSAKKVNKEELQSERASSKEPQKSSLQSFVTKVNKGEVFGSIKKYGEKRDSSARRTQKPQLNLDDRASKPIRAVELDLKGPKTTPNVESKVFSLGVGKSSASPTAASTQTMIVKNNKKVKETPKSVQDAIINAKSQGRDSFMYYQTYLEKAHRWDGEPDYFVQLYQEHFLQTFQALNFVKNIKQTDPAVLAQKRVYFPKRDTHKDKKTLVFDMDETLIHCNESLDMPADVILPILFPNGEVVEAGVNIRPYAIECLRELSQHFEIIVFTASHSCYANVVLDYLDPHEEYIHHRMFRESCVVTDEGLHIKDLRVIGNRNLRDMVLIDNAAYSYGFQLENGIPIVPFYDNKADQELRHLIPYLKFLGSVEDLREVNKQTFKLHHFGAYDEAEELLERVILQN